MTSTLEELNYVALEESIGASTTILSKLWEKHLHADSVLERWEKKPFLEHFYHDRE